jgi:hypothetical protein
MTPASPAHLNPLAALLACLWPGAGHIHRGEKRRGILIMIGVLFLFGSGLLIGGVSVVEHRKPPQPGSAVRALNWWFVAQACNGPIAFAAAYANERFIRQAIPAEQLRMTSIGQVRDIGVLFVALGGLMNLVVILDALHPAPRRMMDRRMSETPLSRTVYPEEIRREQGGQRRG